MGSSVRDKYTPPPPTTRAGAARRITRAAVSGIPLLGGPAAELADVLIAPIAERSQHEWQEAIADAVRQLQHGNENGHAELVTSVARFGRDEYVIASYLQRHLKQQLGATNPHVAASFTAPIKSLLDNRSVRSRLPRSFDIEKAFSIRSITSERLGLMNERIRGALKDLGPLDVAVPHSMTATAAILVYMRDVMRLPLRLVYMAHTPDIVSAISSSKLSPHFCVVTDATFIALRQVDNGREYAFRAFLPTTQLRILTPPADEEPQSSTLLRGRYGLVLDDLSTPLFVLEQLCETHGEMKASIVAEDHQPNECVGLLQSGDPDLRLIIWDAHWRLYEDQGLCRVHVPLPGCVSHAECMLFGRCDLPSAVSDAFIVAFRHAWVELSVDVQRQFAILMMLRDKDFVNGLMCASGLR